jgi:hypothetical protein
MTNPSHHTAQPGETVLEEGLRRYAPKRRDARNVAISDFLVSLLLVDRWPRSRPET